MESSVADFAQFNGAIVEPGYFCAQFWDLPKIFSFPKILGSVSFGS